jgi:hypothetical protein
MVISFAVEHGGHSPQGVGHHAQTGNDARYVEPVELEEILAVLHGWLGTEIEVSAHGGKGMAPISAVSARGRLRAGDVLSRPDRPEVFLFVLVDPGGRQVGSFALDAEAFVGGGWLDQREEVLEVESGVVQLLIATAIGEEPEQAA